MSNIMGGNFYSGMSTLARMRSGYNPYVSSMRSNLRSFAAYGSNGFFNSPAAQMKLTNEYSKEFSKQNSLNLVDLRKAASKLGMEAGNMRAKKLESSNDNVASSSSTIYSGLSREYDVEVTNLAQEQQSVSAEFDLGAASQFDQGLNSVALNVGDKSVNVNFVVNEGDTNEDAMSSLARNINEAGAGVSASVVAGKDGKGYLSLKASGSGTENAFSIADKGNAQALLNVKNSKDAADAKYKINGTEYISSSNSVSVPYSSAKITLNGVGSAKISTKLDTTAVEGALADFADAYNRAVDLLSSKVNPGRGVDRALNYISSRGTGIARLSSIGVSLGTDGKLSIDGKKFKNAIEASPTVVSNTLKNSASSVGFGATSAMSIPSATYTNFSNMGVSSSLIDMFMPSSGSLFDYYL